MARIRHKALILLMWLGLPGGASMYWTAWDRLPPRVAVHFDANWQPNGYTSREAALQLGLGILVVMLVLFSAAMLIIDALKPAAFWPGLVISYVVVGFCLYGNYAIVNYNLQARQVRSVQGGVEAQRRTQYAFEERCRTTEFPGVNDWQLATDN